VVRRCRRSAASYDKKASGNFQTEENMDFQNFNCAFEFFLGLLASNFKFLTKNIPTRAIFFTIF